MFLSAYAATNECQPLFSNGKLCTKNLHDVAKLFHDTYGQGDQIFDYWAIFYFKAGF
jgi:hypothetical protein